MARLFPTSISGINHSTAAITTARSQVAIARIIHALKPPADRPNFGCVVQNCVLALQAYSQRTKGLATDLKLLISEIERLALEVDTSADVYQPVALYRRSSKFSVWALFSRTDFSNANPEWLETAGAELAAALLTNTRVREKIASDLAAARHAPPSSRNQQAEAIGDIRRRVLRRAAVYCELGAATLSADDLRITTFAMRTESRLLAQITQATSIERKAAGTISEQTSNEIASTASELRSRIQAGDIEALLYAMAFVLGLPLELACQTPFSRTGTGAVGPLISIDLNTGLIRTALDDVVNGASPEYPGCSPASRGYARPLPQFLHEALGNAAAHLPSAHFLGDIDPDRTWKAARRRITNSMHEDARVRPSLARFIAARGSLAIRYGIDRAVAAYLTNDFTKIGHARHYYLHLTPQEVWRAASTLFRGLGWGDPVPMPEDKGYGSAVVPENALLTRRHRWMCEELERLRPGRRCRVEQLEKHHHTYALSCADFVNFLLGGRAQLRFHLRASDVHDEAGFVQLPDKRVGPLSGRALIPLSPALQKQVDLWFCHCRSLAQRLEKQGHSPSGSVLRHLHKVLAREDVAMFFAIQEDRIVELGSAEIAAWVPPEFGAKPDFGRHFWQNALRREGLSSADIDLFMRHSTSGLEPHAIESPLILQESFRRIIAAQSRIIAGLALSPMAGLAKG